MACRLNQCWNIVNWTLGNKLQWNFNRNSNIFIEENAFENVVCEMLSISSRPQCVNGRRSVLSIDLLPSCVNPDEMWKNHLWFMTSILSWSTPIHGVNYMNHFSLLYWWGKHSQNVLHQCCFHDWYFTEIWWWLLVYLWNIKQRLPQDKFTSLKVNHIQENTFYIDCELSLHFSQLKTVKKMSRRLV